MKLKGAMPKKIIFYEKKSYVKPWQRYADVLIPLVTIPILIFIGLYLHNYVMDPSQQRDASNGMIFALCGALVLISFAVFCYLCTRLSSPVLSFSKRQFKTNFSMIRSTSSGCFMKSVNSDLQFMVPFNSYPPTYESIIFDVPPSYTVISDTSKLQANKPSTSSANPPLKIVEV